MQSYLSSSCQKFKLFFTSNHDENSWNGTEYEKYGIASRAFAVLAFTWFGFPLIYSGQEIPNKKRLLFFEKDVIDWSYELKLENFYSKLSLLHKIISNEDAIFEILSSEKDEFCFAYIKQSKTELLIIILNLSKQDRIKFSLSNSLISGSFLNVFSEMEYHFNCNENFELMAGDFLVFRKL